ncbi:MAG: diguanylate cyclase [Methylobacterium sp.]|nr:diguanylate cyclase [Methylobacterium sp.]
MLNRLSELDTCTVSDALDSLGLAGATIGVRPLWKCPKIVGRAMTVRAGPKIDAAPTDHLNTPAIEAGGPETVLVIANDGRTDVSCWGDIVSNASIAKGIRGVVIDGACRDIDASEQLGFPVYGRAVVPVSARNRIIQVDYNKPINFSSVSVSPGDYVIADGSGIVFVPAPRISEVLDIADRIAKKQNAMVAAVRAGRSVVEVMHDREFEKAV